MHSAADAIADATDAEPDVRANAEPYGASDCCANAEPDAKPHRRADAEPDERGRNCSTDVVAHVRTF